MTTCWPGRAPVTRPSILSTFSRPPCAEGGILVNSIAGGLSTQRDWQLSTTRQTESSSNPTGTDLSRRRFTGLKYVSARPGFPRQKYRQVISLSDDRGLLRFLPVAFIAWRLLKILPRRIASEVVATSKNPWLSRYLPRAFDRTRQASTEYSACGPLRSLLKCRGARR